jgi:hypothetical protein
MTLQTDAFQGVAVAAPERFKVCDKGRRELSNLFSDKDTVTKDEITNFGVSIQRLVNLGWVAPL